MLCPVDFQGSYVIETPHLYFVSVKIIMFRSCALSVISPTCFMYVSSSAIQLPPRFAVRHESRL